MGESHLMRGVNWTGNFDVGSLAPEAAALRGSRAFSVLVGGGRGARHGVLNPSDMSVADAPADMFDRLGLRFLVDGIGAAAPMLVDLRPLRPSISQAARLKAFNNPLAARIVQAFDTLLIWPASTATRMLTPADD